MPITWPDGQAVMAETDVEEPRVLAQLVVTDDIEDLDSTSDGRANKEFVSLRGEFDALANTLGIERVEHTRRMGDHVEHDDAVVIGSQPGSDSHFTVRVECETLGAVRDLLDHRVDDRWVLCQIGDENVRMVPAGRHGTLTDQGPCSSGADSQDIGAVQELGRNFGSHLDLAQMPNPVFSNGIPLDRRGQFRQSSTLRCQQSMALRVNPETGHTVRLRIATDFEQFSVFDPMDVKVLVGAGDETLSVRVGQNVLRSIVEDYSVHDTIIGGRQVDEGQHVHQLRRHLRLLEHFRRQVGIGLRSIRKFQLFEKFGPNTVIGNQGVAAIAGHGHRRSPENRAGHGVVNRTDDRRMIWPKMDNCKRVLRFQFPIRRLIIRQLVDLVDFTVICAEQRNRCFRREIWPLLRC